MFAAVDEYPRTLAEFEARFDTEEACAAYLARLRWPSGLSVPPLWKRQGVATANGAVAVCGVWPADLGHRGHHLSGHAPAAQDLVSRYVVG